VELVIHAGDYSSPPAIKALEGLNLAGVFGNNDGEKLGIAKTFAKVGGRFEGDFLKIDTGEGAIAVYHGTIPDIKEALGHCGMYRAVISGHTHKIENRLEGRTRMLNPGSAHGFGKEATIMIYETTEDSVDIMTL
jgi:putative phosphoesterase